MIKKKKTDSRPAINSSLQFIYFSFIHSLILLIKRKKSPDVYNTLLKQLFFKLVIKLMFPKFQAVLDG